MIKRVLSIIVSVALVFSLAACKSDDKQTSSSASGVSSAPASQSSVQAQSSEAQAASAPAAPAFDYAEGNAVPKDSGAKWYILNNLTEETVEVNSEYVTANYIQISGLKDKTVEASVNKEIKDTFERLLADDYIPPFENAREALSILDIPAIRYLNCSVDANVNNILCVEFYLEILKSTDDGMNTVCIDERVPLTFDLNTGKHIKFADIFSDDVNAAEYAEQVMNELIADSEEGYLITDIAFKSDFPGFREDQPFIVDSHSNSIGLLFNYDDSYIDFNADIYDDSIFIQTQAVYINLNGVSAMADRFYSKDQPSLFEDESSRKYAIRSNEYNSIGSRYISEPIGDDRITMYLGYVEYPEMIDAVRNYIEESRADAKDLYSRVKAKADALGNSEFDVFGGVEINHYRVGEYTCIDKNINYTIYDEEWNEIDSENKDAASVCFKGSSTEPMKITELFKPGTDCKAVIKSAFIQNAEQYLDEYGFEIEMQRLEPFFDEMINSISGFKIDEYGLTFSFLNADKTIAKRFSDYDEEELWIFSYICSFAEFDKLGFDNITVFE